ncbi:MAG: hypothetical protein KJZ75_13945 [Hyphomonadaceae bacterium]|nr:hypothetical protein [Hyphomonadaceae bacterium]
MGSFNVVNYSLRPSKSVQRQIIFEGVRLLHDHLDLDGQVYVGFGSVWFTDFVLAHKLLGIRDMVSIEADDVGFRRAKFNAPYATVRVVHGRSTTVLPELYKDELITNRPWLIWMDFDYEFDESMKDDIRALIENATENSILIATFNGNEMKYGNAPERPERLRELFGSVVPDELSKKACKDERMQQTLADLSLDFMRSVAAEQRRPGGFVPAFRAIYKDTTPMVTVGGILPAKGAARVASDVVKRESWPCWLSKPIVAPHLTTREAAVLQAQLPRAGKLSRALVQSLGFDLEDDQIEAFEAYYKHYPAFAQVIS